MTYRCRFRSVLAVVVGASALTACGSSSGSIVAVGGPGAAGSSGDAVLVSLRKAAADATGVTSGRFEMAMSMQNPAEGGSMTMTLTQSRTGDRSRFSMTGQMDGAAASQLEDLGFAELLDLDVIQIGGDAYLRGGMVSMLTDTEGAPADRWWKVPGGSASDPTESAPMSPDSMTGLLDGAMGTVTRIGEEEILGVATTHYEVMFDLERAMGSSLRSLPSSFLQGRGGTVPLHLYVDGMGLMRRMAFVIADSGALVSMRLDCTDLGSTDIVIEPPSEFTEMDPALGGGLLGGD